MKKMMKKVNNNERSNLDRISIFDESNKLMNANIDEVETFYTKINNIYSNQEYLSVIPEDSTALEARRRTLEIQFRSRVEFLLNTRLDIIMDVLRFNGIIECRFPLIVDHCDFDSTIPELFSIFTYIDIINNQNTATDYAMAMNSIIYNKVFIYANEIEDLNKYMMHSMNECIDILNILNYEASKVYYPAGYPNFGFAQADMYASGCCAIQGVDVNETVDLREGNIIASGIVNADISNRQHIELTGQERANALIEMGEAHLINTDVKVGRF